MAVRPMGMISPPAASASALARRVSSTASSVFTVAPRLDRTLWLQACLPPWGRRPWPNPALG